MEEPLTQDSSGSDASEHWDAHYGERPQIWSGRPNAVLVEETRDLTPGVALDIGCGEGADAVWLAREGWKVTAVDVSRTALDRAARVAKEAGVDRLIDFQWHDLAHTRPEGVYDLVSAQYLHAPIEFPRDRVLRDAASLVAPGGTFLAVSHAASPPWAKHAHADREFPRPEDDAAAAALHEPDWELLICEVRERETVSPDGEPATITDTIVKARRRNENS